MRYFAFVLILALSIGALSVGVYRNSGDKSGVFVVTRVVDGDTYVVGPKLRVRIIGVNTPETYKNEQYYGREATAYAKKLVEGKRVRLEYDIQEQDRYGRVLAYVFLMDSTFVNAELVRHGYANVMTIPPNVKYSELFRKLESEARSKKLGLWQVK